MSRVTCDMSHVTFFFWTKWLSLSVEQWEEKSTTMQPMVGGMLSKSEESYPNARETRALEIVQFQGKVRNFFKK